MKKSFIKSVLLSLCVFIILAFPFTKEPSYTPGNKYTSVINAIKKTYPKSTDTIRVMSYNLLADTPGYYGSPAYSRSAEVNYLLNSLKPDVTGLQEVSRNWFYSLNEGTDYNFISPLRTTLFGTMTTIIYNKNTLDLSHWGEYVFENTLNAKLRCVVWGLFRQKSTARNFIVINTHLSLSYEKKDTPIKQVTEVLELVQRLKEQYDCPVFFTGDFNSDKSLSEKDYSSCVYEVLCTYFTDTLNKTTETSYGKNLNTKSHRVDHIFLRGEADIVRYIILSQPQLAETSDHYPIFIDLLL